MANIHHFMGNVEVAINELVNLFPFYNYCFTFAKSRFTNLNEHNMYISIPIESHFNALATS